MTTIIKKRSCTPLISIVLETDVKKAIVKKNQCHRALTFGVCICLLFRDDCKPFNPCISESGKERFFNCCTFHDSRANAISCGCHGDTSRRVYAVASCTAKVTVD